MLLCFFFKAEAGIRVLVGSRGRGEVYKRQDQLLATGQAVACSLAQVVAAKWRNQPVDPRQWLVLGLVLVLGAGTLIAMFRPFVKDNFPRAYDRTWLAKGGGLLSRNTHVPLHRFNGGEKLLFWGGLVLLGMIVTVTGFILDFPNYGQTRAQMQQAWTIHVIAALLFIALIAGHIYIGTIGTEGALAAMKTGYVDETWAKEHHEYWHDDVKAGKIAAQRSARAGAAAAGAAAQARG